MTVKMRLGWDHDQYTAPAIAADAVKAGAKMIAVHGRTKSDGYKNRSLWHEVRHVVDAVDVPVLVNGDIVDPASARAALKASGAAGVMVGRGVMTDPWCLARISADLRGEAFDEPTLGDRERLLFDYIDDLARDGNGRRTLGKLKRVMGYFSKGLWGAGQLRRALNGVREVDAARLLLRDFFAEVREREADQRALEISLAARRMGASA
jgi:tRNA-dihydrouridine synthase B